MILQHSKVRTALQISKAHVLLWGLKKSACEQFTNGGPHYKHGLLALNLLSVYRRGNLGSETQTITAIKDFVIDGGFCDSMQQLVDDDDIV